MPKVEVVTEIRGVPGACFDAARDMDLHARSMAEHGERIVAGRRTGLIELGEVVTFEARHFGWRWRFEAEVTAFDRPRHFRDEMKRGPFKAFAHDHHFELLVDGLVRMTDRVVFTSPFGPVGWVVDRLVMARHIKRLLTARAQAVRVGVESAPTGGF